MPRSRFTRKMFDDGLVKYAKSRRKNPVKGGTCVYRLGSRHCIVGQMLVDNGLPLPPRELGEKSVWDGALAHLTISPGVLDDLSELQRIADEDAALILDWRWGKSIERFLAKREGRA